MTNQHHAVAVLVILIATTQEVGADAAAVSAQGEPNAAVAATWWPPQMNVWTPIGWKDHLFRFNVLYNGTVVALPHVRKDREVTRPWADQGVMLTIHPSAGKKPTATPTAPYQLCDAGDRGIGNQGWLDRPTPVLWTEWPLSNVGLVVREEVFAHLSGATHVKTGIEPLYAWIRLSVQHVDELKAPETIPFIVVLQAPGLDRSMNPDGNLTVSPDRLSYPRPLSTTQWIDGDSEGLRFVEPDGRIRLAGVPTEPNTFRPGPSEHQRYDLQVVLPARSGAHADLLLPMLPGNEDDVLKELALGFDAALAEADAYWSDVPDTAALIDTPEKQVNDAIAQGVKLAQIITETQPDSGDVSFLSGSMQYDALWPTPTSMVGHMMLDPLGYHDFVARHIALFRTHQGSVKPPGPSYTLHPGYFSSPKTLTSIDWLADHGAILYLAARHALIADDPAFLKDWIEPIVKGCEFIRDARAVRDHDGAPGVLPPAVATDVGVATQSVWTVGWNYKGLTTAVRLLERIDHPRAAEFAEEARAYKTAFIDALNRQAGQMPEWIDARGDRHRLVPDSVSAGGDTSHPFYLDTGPLFLVWAGLCDADHPWMRSTCAFFREGPNTRIFDDRGSFSQRAILQHEISSCEPCYSWNVYHSWQLADRYRYLEGTYSLLAGALSGQTYISCETRHGIYGNVFVTPLLVDLVRLSVIDDALRGNELHLLRLAPRAWLRADHETRFERIATEFGPVTLKCRLAAAVEQLQVIFESRFHHPPDKVLLHVPPVPGLGEVIVNGRAFKAAPGDVVTISD